MENKNENDAPGGIIADIFIKHGTWTKELHEYAIELGEQVIMLSH
jgi:hypothetical protein